MNEKKHDKEPEKDAKEEAVKNPTREDVHEQREHEQPNEGVVTPDKRSSGD